MISPDCPDSSGDTGASQCGKADTQGNEQQQQQDDCFAHAGQGQWASMVAGHANGNCECTPAVQVTIIDQGHEPAHGQDSMGNSGFALMQLPDGVQGQKER
jgi:hypothetical protein